MLTEFDQLIRNQSIDQSIEFKLEIRFSGRSALLHCQNRLSGLFGFGEQHHPPVEQEQQPPLSQPIVRSPLTASNRSLPASAAVNVRSRIAPLPPSEFVKND